MRVHHRPPDHSLSLARKAGPNDDSTDADGVARTLCWLASHFAGGGRRPTSRSPPAACRAFDARAFCASMNCMENGSITIQEKTGRWPVYPGHPLVLATAIMKVFRTFEEANEPSGRGWCVALAESRIPGAGDHVGAAMQVLE